MLKYKYSQSDSYVGAVVEYEPIGTPWDSTPEELLRRNTEKYIEIISNASIQVGYAFT